MTYENKLVLEARSGDFQCLKNPPSRFFRENLKKIAKMGRIFSRCAIKRIVVVVRASGKAGENFRADFSDTF